MLVSIFCAGVEISLSLVGLAVFKAVLQTNFKKLPDAVN